MFSWIHGGDNWPTQVPCFASRFSWLTLNISDCVACVFVWRGRHWMLIALSSGNLIKQIQRDYAVRAFECILSILLLLVSRALTAIR